MTTAKPSLRKAAARSLLFYTLDMTAAILGFVYGFGLQVKSWPALIGIMLAVRWIMHLLQHAWYYRDAKDKVAQEGGAA